MDSIGKFQAGWRFGPYDIYVDAVPVDTTVCDNKMMVKFDTNIRMVKRWTYPVYMFTVWLLRLFNRTIDIEPVEIPYRARCPGERIINHAQEKEKEDKKTPGL